MNETLQLKIAHADARRKLEQRFEEGKELFSDHPLTLHNAERWDRYNETLLRTVFVDEQPVIEYRGHAGVFVIGDTRSDQQLAAEMVRRKLGALDILLNKLELYSEPDIIQPGLPSTTIASGDRVFVVHGHDEAAKQSVCRTLEQLGLDPVVLGEQPGGSATIIEKLEANADVGYAVVLLTADDIGKAKTVSEFRPRARQNVLIELGLFVAKLGRARVSIMLEEGVEIPSDVVGVGYIKIDQAGGWKLALCKDLKLAGYSVDANNL